MTYFKLPINYHFNITQANIKLQFKEKDDYNIICSYNLQKYLTETKKKIDNISYLWDSVKIYTNPYEFIHTTVPHFSYSVSKYKPISRAFYKLLEIYNLFNITNISEPINTFHLAEGPGGFVEATMFIRNNKKDNYVGMTLLDRNSNTPGWKKSKKFLDKFPNISLEVGKDNTGNLYNEENYIFCCKRYTKKFEIITGDGGIDFSGDYNNQEQTASRLIITQLFYALSMQKIGGTFILKMFDLFTKVSIDVVYLLTIFYKKVFIVKPYTSRYANSEKYIVAMDFKENISEELQNKFFGILKILNNIDFNKYQISSILNLKQNLYFMNHLEEINIILGQRQIENILYTIKIINNRDKYNDKIEKFKSTNIIRSIKWCNNNNLETNNFDSLINPINIFLKK